MSYRALLLVLVAATAAAAELTILEEDSPAHLTGLGNEALVDGRYEIAASLYRRALEQDADYVTARFNLGLAYQRLDDLVAAKTAYEAVLERRGDHAPALANLGWLAWKRGDHDAAALHYGEAVRTAASPRNQAEYAFSLGSVREAQGRSQDARRAYDQALAAWGDHVGARFNLGSLLLAQAEGNPATLALAREHLERAVAIDSSQVDAWLNLAICRERQGDDTAALAYDQAVTCAVGTHAARAYWRRALWHDRQIPPRRVAMRDDLAACLAADPDFPEANGRLGAYYHAIGDFDRALALLGREVNEANDRRTAADREAHFLLAEIYTDHRPDAAKALFHATAAQDTGDDPRLRELHRRVDTLLTPPPKPQGP